MRPLKYTKFLLILLSLCCIQLTGYAGGGSDHAHSHDADGHTKKEFDFAEMVMDHISDANDWHLFGDVSIPLPVMVYHPEHGFDMFMSSVFHHGHNSHKGYILDHGVVRYVDDPNFPKDQDVPVHVHKNKEAKTTEVSYNGQTLTASRSSFYDFSITKVVANMLLAALIMFLVFFSVARAYRKNDVPKGLQSFMEPLITFVRDDIAKPNLGDKTEKYLPFLLCIFFFIWICNMLGLVPFLGSPNITGNIAVTLTLSLFTFFVIVVSGTKDYWMHIVNPPGVPFAVKIILVIIEVISVFMKPFALMVRLFANITGGHIIILSLVGMIFIFANMAGTGAGLGVSVLSSAFMLFMNFLEMFVAALQAYIFTILSAVFIGQALEEHHHHEEAHH